MTDGHALLHAIFDSPDDDAPRLVYADWLDEHGEPDRAEFIRVQCELASIQRLAKEKGERAGPPAKVINSLADRERELLSEPRHFVNWTPSVLHTGSGAGIRCVNPPTVELSSKGFRSAEFRRGFIEFLTCTATNWVVYATAILAEHPVTRVLLTSFLSLADADKLGRLVPWEAGDEVLGRLWPGIDFEYTDQVPQPIGSGEDLDAAA